MDSLNSILSLKDFGEPPEAQSIKKYVQELYKVPVSVMVREKDIVIIVPSASLANSLRLKSQDMKRRCQLTKRLSFRIG